MILKDIWLDVKAVQERDPAARSALEVLLLYQGVHALILHRFAHWFYRHRLFFIARWISQVARFFTLIEIHPGAEMGHGILIDHGCGVVIGETTVVGDNCTIYQGVTLGGVGLEKGKRHPTLGNNVTVGAGAKILGAFEVGDNCTIAANAVLLKPLESDTTAVGIPARPVKVGGVPVPKAMAAAVTMEEYARMQERVLQLEEDLEVLRETLRRKEEEEQLAAREKAARKAEKEAKKAEKAAREKEEQERAAQEKAAKKAGKAARKEAEEDRGSGKKKADKEEKKADKEGKRK